MEQSQTLRSTDLAKQGFTPVCSLGIESQETGASGHWTRRLGNRLRGVLSVGFRSCAWLVRARLAKGLFSPEVPFLFLGFLFCAECEPLRTLEPWRGDHPCRSPLYFLTPLHGSLSGNGNPPVMREFAPCHGRNCPLLAPGPCWTPWENLRDWGETSGPGPTRPGSMPASTTRPCDDERPPSDSEGAGSIVNLPRGLASFLPGFCRPSIQENSGLAGSPDSAISETCSWISIARAMHWSEL